MIYGLEPLRWGTFCKSKIVCAEIKGEYVLCFTLYRCRRATGKGRLCFINRKGKTFISDIRVFVIENACFFFDLRKGGVKVVGFLSILLLFCM